MSMAMNQEIRDYISSTSLKDNVKAIYSLGRARPLYGANSVMLRTLGDRFQGANSYQRSYFDEFKGKEVMTEFAEFCESLRDYDNSRTKDNLIEIILEAGDLLFQSIVLDSRHKENRHYSAARNEMDKALLYVEDELIRRGLSMQTVKNIAKVKYGVRSWMVLKGLPSKNKDLEKQFCLEELSNLQ
jgi:hypothetical protein